MDYINSNAKLKTVPDLNGGVNYYEEPHKIRDNQLADVCNMEFEDGILRQRSGYEMLISHEGIGQVLCAKEFDGKIYFACTDALVSVDMQSNELTVLARNLNLEKPGTFIFRGDILYYFSGKAIYKFGKNCSEFNLQKLNVEVPSVVCELEENIYTDGNKVYDFSGVEVNVYDVTSVETFSFDHMCKYGNIIYGVKKNSPTDGAVRIVGIEFEKLSPEDGEPFYSAVCCQLDTTVTFPFQSGTQYITNYGNFIRGMDAVKGYLLFQCDVIVWPNGTTNGVTNPYSGYCPVVIKYNLETGEVSSLSAPPTTNSNYIYELYSKWNDTVLTLKEDRKYTDRTTLTIQNYETGQSKTIRCSFMKISDDDSGIYGKASLSYLTAVADDLFVLTYRTTGNNYMTKLFQILENAIYEVDSSSKVIGYLKKIGSNFYDLPVEPDFYELIGLYVDRSVVTPYHFTKAGIQAGYEYISETTVDYTGYDFTDYKGNCCRLASAEFTAIKAEGYVPVVLEARFVTSAGNYQTVAVEQYNILSRYAKVRFAEAVSSDVLTVELPISFHTVERIISTRSEDITISKSGENTLVTNAKPFEIGEELLILSADTGTVEGPENCHLAIPYGGSSYTEGSGTRLFAAGDPKNGNTYYYSDVNNFEYFPELNFDILDNSSAPITGFAKHYQDLIVFKSDSISKLSYQYEESKVVFPVVNVHDSIGCDMPGSIQMVNNDVVFGNALKGLHLLSIKELSDERNVFPISMNLNGRKGLGKYSVFEKQNARSFDFKNKYYLAVGDDIYIWNYELTPFQGYQENISWYVWRDIPVSSFCTAGDCLAFVPRGSFALYAFNGAKDDGGKAIRASFTTKAFDFGDANALKTVWQVWMNITSDRDFPLYFKSVNEKGECLGHTISFHANRHFGNVMTRRMKHKRILYLGFHLENGEQGTAFDVSNIKIEYEIYKSRR